MVSRQHDNFYCGAKTRNGTRCRHPKAPGKKRCWLHGGAPGSGAPSGERNGSFKDGAFTKQAIAERKWAKGLVRALINELIDGKQRR